MKINNTESIPRNRKSFIAVGLLFAFLLTTCVVDRSLWRGATTAKYFYFTAMLCLAMPLTGYRITRRKCPFPLIRSTDIVVSLFVLYVVLHRVIMGGGNKMHWWIFLLMIPFYALVRILTEHRDGARALAMSILVIVLIQTFWGIFQLAGLLPSYHNVFRVTGSLFNPAPYGGIMAVSIPLALGWLFSREVPRAERVLSGTVLVTSLLVLPFTGSRAAWLAAMAGVLTVVWQTRVKNGKGTFLPPSLHGRNRLLLYILLAISTIILVYGLYNMRKDSADGRWLIWNVSATIIKGNPAGVGAGRFAAAYGQAQADYFLSGRGTSREAMLADHPDYAFNEAAQVAVELGLAGLFLSLVVVGSSLWPKQARETFKNGKRGAGYCFSSFIALLVFSLFSYPFSVLPLSILFVTLLAVLASRTPPLRHQPSFKGHVAGWTVLVLLTAAVATRVLPRWQSYREWQEAHLLFRSGDDTSALEEYRVLYVALKHEKNFLLEYARCLSHLGQHEESNHVIHEYLHLGCNPEAYNYMGINYKELARYDMAEEAYIRSSLITPNRHYPEYLLMKLYHDMEKENEAVEKARFLIEKPVKVNSPVIEHIRSEAIKILETTNYTKE